MYNEMVRVYELYIYIYIHKSGLTTTLLKEMNNKCNKNNRK